MQAAGQMAEGNIAADPYWHDGASNACRWCEYKSACHFEECCGDQRRLRKNLSGAAFWAQLEQREEAEDHGV
jgi:ATP-dependent helicase/nuclease subunit B